MATTTSPSPRPVLFTPPPLHSTSPSPLGRNASSTPPPRPPSSQGVSVFAPRPMRLPLYRPQFSRQPVSMSETPSEKDRVGSPAPVGDRRSSSASLPGVSENDQENSVESKVSTVYSPNKDALEELYKIMHKRSASRGANSTALFKSQALHPRSPNMSHRRNTSDASESGLTSKTPDADWRPIPVSPVARSVVRNPMVRDPSFNSPAAVQEPALDDPERSA